MSNQNPNVSQVCIDAAKELLTAALKGMPNNPFTRALKLVLQTHRAKKGVGLYQVRDCLGMNDAQEKEFLQSILEMEDGPGLCGLQHWLAEYMLRAYRSEWRIIVDPTEETLPYRRICHVNDCSYCKRWMNAFILGEPMPTGKPWPVLGYIPTKGSPE